MDKPIRVLFVDDEPHVLASLRRSLRKLRGRWEMGFEPGGEEALQELSRQEYDVIVTDMRMPCMDGAQLLEEVKPSIPTWSASSSPAIPSCRVS